MPASSVLDEPEGDTAVVAGADSPSAPQASERNEISSGVGLEPQIRAERRREDFKLWMLPKVRHSHRRAALAMGSPDGRRHSKRGQAETADERRQRRLKQLQERLAAADQSRRQALEQVRQRAAQLSTRRGADDPSRLHQERQELLSNKIYEGLKAAEGRRQALKEAERERLRSGRQLVFTRLALSQERAAVEVDEHRRRIDARLQLAEEARNAKLSARAGDKAARKARGGGGLLSRAMADQRALQQHSDERDSPQGAPAELDAFKDLPDTSDQDVLKRPKHEQDKQEDALRLARAEDLRRHVSSRTLGRFWRGFVRKRQTTAVLAEAFVKTGVTGLSDASNGISAALQSEPATSVVSGGGQHRQELEQFERFAGALRASSTLKAAQVLLHRLEVRLSARGVESLEASCLLRRLFPSAPKDKALERYPARVFLCAYMVLQHPEVVFSKTSELEERLSAAGKEMLGAFEALLKRILDPPLEPLSAASADSGTDDLSLASPVARGMHSFRAQAQAAAAQQVGLFSPYTTIGEHLVRFDHAWLRYLERFVSWKFEDAASLEHELLRMAVEMEKSMRRKCRGGPDSERVRRSSDLQALVAQVAFDHGLLRERIAKLAGEAGVARLEAALEQARASVRSESETETETETDSGQGSPTKSSPDNSGGLPLVAEPAAASAPSPPPPPPVPVKPKPSGLVGGFFNRAPRVVPKITVAASPPSTPSTTPSPSPHAGERPRFPADASSFPLRDANPLGGGGSSAASTSRVTGGSSSVAGSSAAVAIPAPMVSPSGRQAAGAASVGWSPAASLPHSPSSLPPPRPDLPVESLSNVHMVWELVHNPLYQLPADEAVAAWQRARGSGEGLEAIREVDASELEAMSPEQVVALLRGRAKVQAERAFWDSIAQRLELALQDGNVTGLMIPLLSEVAAELAGTISDSVAATAVRAELSEEALTAALVDSAQTVAGGSVGRLQLLLGSIARLAALLLQWGAPAREAEAVAAQQELRRELTDLLTMWATGGATAAANPTATGTAATGGGADDARRDVVRRLAASLARSVRLLSAQLKLLKLDAANGRLMLLSRSLRGTDGAVGYLHMKFATLYRLYSSEGDGGTTSAAAAPADSSDGVPAANSNGSSTALLPAARLAAALPLTTHWLQSSQPFGAAITQYLAAAGVSLLDSSAGGTAAAASNGVPMQLRTGVRNVGTVGGAAPASTAEHPTAGGAAAAAARSALRPVRPVPLRSWRGAVRVGFVALVTGKSPAVSRALAETLTWDVERLHAAQNDFQQLLVVAAGLLLIGQARSAAAAAQATRAAFVPASSPATTGVGAGIATGATAGAVAASGATAGGSAGGGWSLTEQVAARRRLMVVLADPGMRLPDLVSELGHLAGAADVETEGRLRDAFLSVMEPDSAAFRSISSALAAALLAQLLTGEGVAAGGGGGAAGAAGGSGGGSASAAALRGVLARIGASALAEDLGALTERMGALVAANEAVHGEVYERLIEAATA